jgi:hypothetical protein
LSTTPSVTRPSWGCSGCPTRWTSLIEAHCPVCHKHFRGMNAADRHRRNAQCLAPETARTLAGDALYVRSERGTTLNKAPVWTLAKNTSRQWSEAVIPLQREPQSDALTP